MFRSRFFLSINAVILGLVALACPGIAGAQRHGGGGGAGSGGLGSIGRPTGVDEKDSLKDFHEAMAVQATGQQISEFILCAFDTGVQCTPKSLLGL